MAQVTTLKWLNGDLFYSNESVSDIKNRINGTLKGTGYNGMYQVFKDTAFTQPTNLNLTLVETVETTTVS